MKYLNTSLRFNYLRIITSAYSSTTWTCDTAFTRSIATVGTLIGASIPLKAKTSLFG